MPRARFATVSLLAAIGATAPAFAADKHACVASYTHAQELRRAGKLQAARQELLACSQQACPSLVRTDCTKWIGEVEAALPTIIVRARDAAGNDLTDVRVLLDGAPLATHLDGRPVTVDPGPHDLRFERTDAPAIEQSVVVIQAEKNRIVTASFPAPAAAAPTPAPAPVSPPAAPPQPKPAPPNESRGLPTGAIVLGAVSLAAFGVSSYFGVKGWSDLTHLHNTCAPHCNPSDGDSARHELQASDISALVGLLAAGGVAWILLSRSHEAPSAALSITPIAGGGAARLQGSF